MYSQEFIEEMRQKLLEHKANLAAELSGIKEHTEMGEGEDENAQELATGEVNHDLRERIASDLDKINAALQRIEAGTYGVAADGRVIGEERLRVIPWADTAL